jgi:hypothetical protein
MDVSGWSVLCCTCRHPEKPDARMLSGSLPYGVRTFLFRKAKATARPAPLHGPSILTKNVEHLKSKAELRLFSTIGHCLEIDDV